MVEHIHTIHSHNCVIVLTILWDWRLKGYFTDFLTITDNLNSSIKTLEKSVKYVQS